MFAILFLCLVAAATWALHAVVTEDDHGFLPWREPAVVGAGHALYTQHCAACHGMPDGSAPPPAGLPGTPAPPHDRTGHTWQHPDFALFQLVRDGVAVANCAPVNPELMPKFKGKISDSDLVAILSYIKSTWPEDIRRGHDQINMMYGPYNRAVEKLIDLDQGGRG
jgi:mono/diheme cytochrome c family protein